MFLLPATITHISAMQVRDEGMRRLVDAKENRIVNGEQLKAFDSTALSVLVSLVRHYPDVKMINMPLKLVSLSKVYGVDTMLPMEM
jgi:ABC-type transporter Mla MlaB component